MADGGHAVASQMRGAALAETSEKKLVTDKALTSDTDCSKTFAQKRSLEVLVEAGPTAIEIGTGDDDADALLVDLGPKAIEVELLNTDRKIEQKQPHLLKDEGAIRLQEEEIALQQAKV